jgi:hypothetical protein
MAPAKRNRTRSLRAVLGLALLAGCEPRQPAGDGDHPGAVATDVILTVVNQSGRRVRVSLATDSLGYVLGVVERRASRSFSLPGGLGTSTPAMHFSAAWVGGHSEAARSDDFAVRRGDKVVWTLVEGGRGTVTRK